MPPLSYELKYCERCGSLGLRRAASSETYCEPCRRMLINFSLLNHAERASQLHRKPTGKSVVPMIGPGLQTSLAFGRLQ
jgi:hypothetical protein